MFSAQETTWITESSRSWIPIVWCGLDLAPGLWCWSQPKAEATWRYPTLQKRCFLYHLFYVIVKISNLLAESDWQSTENLRHPEAFQRRLYQRRWCLLIWVGQWETLGSNLRYAVTAFSSCQTWLQWPRIQRTLSSPSNPNFNWDTLIIQLTCLLVTAALLGRCILFSGYSKHQRRTD